MISNQATTLDMQTTEEIKTIVSKMTSLETQIKQLKELEKQYSDFKSQLYNVMIEKHAQKFISISGVQYTVVDPTPEKIELTLSFNEQKFKEDNPTLYKKYVEQKENIKKSRAGYLRITLPKTKEEK